MAITETLLTYVPDKILNKKLTLHSLLVLEFASDKHLVAYSLNRSISEWGSVWVDRRNSR
jgi:hypothetical protein